MEITFDKWQNRFCLFKEKKFIFLCVVGCQLLVLNETDKYE